MDKSHPSAHFMRGVIDSEHKSQWLPWVVIATAALYRKVRSL